MAAVALTTLTLQAFGLVIPQPGTSDSLTSLSSLTLSTRPDTGLWRGPPTAGSAAPGSDQLNAPHFVAKIPLASFKRARVTISGLEFTRNYDQGGLVFLFPQPAQGSTVKRAWVKAGVEMIEDQLNLVSIATQAASTSDGSVSRAPDRATSFTIELSREEVNLQTGTGASMFFHLIETGTGGETRKLLRHVSWVFAQEYGTVEVGIYAARGMRKPEDVPLGNAEVLKVLFSNLVLEHLENVPIVEPPTSALTLAPTTPNSASLLFSHSSIQMAMLFVLPLYRILISV